MKKIATVIMSLAFASTMTTPASADFGSLAYIPQISQNAAATISTADIVGPALNLTQQLSGMQTGPGNLGHVWQNGDRNEGLIVQRGSGNIALIAQSGSDNYAAIRQSGNHHRAMAFQQGRNNVAVIRQR